MHDSSNILKIEFISLVELAIVGILRFISRLNRASESFKTRKNLYFCHFIFYECRRSDRLSGLSVA